MTKPQPTPTREQFTAYSQMFDYFNRALFDGKLPPTMLNFSRKARTNGFFAPQRWERGSKVRHEISINPSTLKHRRPIDVASTLVHEMCHLWQQEHGTPSRSGYHNREWSAQMEAVGLTPSTTGQPGGAKVGQRVTHFITVDGRFERAFKAMPRDFLLPWSCGDLEESKPSTARNKVKYTCPGCSCNVWGKPDLDIACNECDESFEVVE